MQLWPETSVTSEPFEHAIGQVGATGVDFKRVLWVIPRIEAAGRFKACWVRYFNNQPCIAPNIQTADRLSQAQAKGPWWALKASLYGLLRNLPGLTGALSSEQVWALAQEYLELAMRLVLVRHHDHSAWANYVVSNQFSAQEAQVVANLAETFESELLACVPSPAWSATEIDRIVWFDDAEQVPALWFKRFFPSVPVHRIPLLLVQGADAWRALARERREGLGISIAADETAQAQQAAEQVLEWLAESDSTEIAIAVLDRLAARRLLAALVGLNVLVDDRTGWRLSTSNVAGWFDGVLSTLATHGQIESIAHPFSGCVLPGFSTWALVGKHALPAWANAFLGLLNRIGLVEVLRTDEAGRLILSSLRQMAAIDTAPEFDAAGFLSAWRHWAENERFRPLDIESRIRLLPLMSTRLRQFDRVLVLGCAQSHFQESPPGLLPPSVAQELGFPGPRIARIQKLSALYELMLNTPRVRLVHAAMSQGKPATLLPELQWFDIVLLQDGGPVQAHSMSPRWLIKPSDSKFSVNHAKPEDLHILALPGGGSVPEQLSVTALDDFVACPLQFALKHSLPWPNAREKSRASFEQLRGIFVHRVLEKTARQMTQAGFDPNSLAVWKRVLIEQGEAVFAKMNLQDQSTLYPFIAQFEKLVPRIAGSLMTRRIEGGWVFEDAERVIEGKLQLKQAERSIRLKGRVDRLDVRSGDMAISDIKFKNHQILKKWAADPLTSPQLPAYQRMMALHAGQGPAKLAFFGLHKNNVAWVEFTPLPDDLLKQGFSTWGDALFAKLEHEMDLFFSGVQPWRAQPGDACMWCEVREVCRPGDLALNPGDEQDDEVVQ